MNVESNVSQGQVTQLVWEEHEEPNIFLFFFFVAFLSFGFDVFFPGHQVQKDPLCLPFISLN